MCHEQVFTKHVSREGTAVGHIHPSVRFCCYLFNQLTSDLIFCKRMDHCNRPVWLLHLHTQKLSMLTSYYSTGSWRSHRCCLLANNVEFIGHGQARAAVLRIMLIMLTFFTRSVRTGWRQQWPGAESAIYDLLVLIAVLRLCGCMSYRGACVAHCAGWKITMVIHRCMSRRTAFPTAAEHLMTTTASTTCDDTSTNCLKVTVYRYRK